jgi:hypothetical protein
MANVVMLGVLSIGVARVAPVGRLGGLPLLVLGEARGDALEQVLGFGVPRGVAAGGGLWRGRLRFGVPHCDSIHRSGAANNQAESNN